MKKRRARGKFEKGEEKKVLNHGGKRMTQKNEKTIKMRRGEAKQVNK